MREQRREIRGSTSTDAGRNKDYEESERAETCPVLKGGAWANTTIVQHGENGGESQSDGEVREKHGPRGDAVEFDGVEARENVGGNTADGDGFPRADDEIGESHHPTGGEADGARKHRGGVSDFAGGIGHGNDEFAVGPADGQQERTSDDETEDGAKSAAAEKPVVHDDEPADADHAAPSQGEVVDEAQFASESGHVARGRESASGANYKAFCCAMVDRLFPQVS